MGAAMTEQGRATADALARGRLHPPLGQVEQHLTLPLILGVFSPANTLLREFAKCCRPDMTNPLDVHHAPARRLRTEATWGLPLGEPFWSHGQDPTGARAGKHAGGSGYEMYLVTPPEALQLIN